MPARREYNFGDLGAQCSLVEQVCNKSLKPEVRAFYLSMHRVQQLKEIKFFVFALFITLFLEFQLRAWFPGDEQRQAIASIAIAIGILVAMWYAEHSIMSLAVCPAELRQCTTPDEQTAIAHAMINGLPLPRHMSANEASKCLFTEINENGEMNPSEEESSVLLLNSHQHKKKRGGGATTLQPADVNVSMRP